MPTFAPGTASRRFSYWRLSRASIPISTLLIHTDADRYLENWVLVHCSEEDVVQGHSGIDGHAADVGGTHLPLRGSVLHLLPGIGVAHAFFKYEPHSGHDGGAAAAPLLRGGAGKRPVGFQLQSGGCKVTSLLERFIWLCFIRFVFYPVCKRKRPHACPASSRAKGSSCSWSQAPHKPTLSLPSLPTESGVFSGCPHSVSSAGRATFIAHRAAYKKLQVPLCATCYCGLWGASQRVGRMPPHAHRAGPEVP